MQTRILTRPAVRGILPRMAARPLPPPIRGAALMSVETDAGRVAAYVLGHGPTVLLLHSFNAAGSGAELAPLAERLAAARRVVLVDWLGFGTSARPDAPYGPAFYAVQLERIREAVLAPGETAPDVVALSLPAQYVVIAAAEHPERFGRLALISPTGFGRFKAGDPRTSRRVHGLLRSTGLGRALFAFLARRRIIRWFLAQIFADPARIPEGYARYCWQSCQQPGAFHAPLAFVCGVLNDPRAEVAYGRLVNATLLLFGDHPRFADPAAADDLVAANANLSSRTVANSGDLPQIEAPDVTAAAVLAFLSAGAGRP